MTMTAATPYARRAILAATLLAGLGLCFVSNAEEQAQSSAPGETAPAGPTVDLVAVGSVTAAGAPIVTGSPVTTMDIDPALCAGGQLVRNFVSGDLRCEWVVAE